MRARQMLLARGLFWLVTGLAGLLLAGVLLAPLVETEPDPAAVWPRVVALFAHDRALRRTSLASAAGLMVSACVFFRGGGRRGLVPSSLPPQRPRAPAVPGA